MGLSTKPSPKQPAKPSLGATIAVAAVSALIGFAAVYVTLGSPDNAGSATGAPQSTAAGAQVAAPPASGEVGKSEDAGKLAAFVRRKTPEALPDVSFIDAKGGPKTLKEFKGKAVLLNLWATWCAPCRREMPSLDRLQKEMGSDSFEVVALAVDRNGLDAAKKFLDEIKVTNLAVYADPTAKAGSALKAVGLPTTILIDKDGNELGRLPGPAEWDSPEAKTLIKAALK